MDSLFGDGCPFRLGLRKGILFSLYPKRESQSPQYKEKAMEEIPKSVYRRHIKRNKEAGNWFTFYRPYTKILPRLTSLFLQDLINLASTNNIIRKEIDGKEFILCMSSFLEKSQLEWTEREQKYHLHILKEQEFVIVVRKGIPAKRWIHFDLEKIEKGIDAVLDGQKRPNQSEQKRPNQSEQKRTDYIEEGIKEEKNNKSVARETRNSETSSNMKSETKKQRKVSGELNGTLLSSESQQSILASKLYKIVDSHGKLRPKPKSIIPWQNKFSELIAAGFSYEEIDASLTWYNKWFNDQHTPKPYCANSYYEKFQKILDAMERTGEKFVEEKEVKVTKIVENGKEIYRYKLPEYDE